MYLGHTVAGGVTALLCYEPQRVYLQHTWALPQVLLVMCKCLEILTVSLKNFSWLKGTFLKSGWRSTQGNHWSHRDCKHWESEQGPGIEVSQGHTTVSNFSCGAWGPAADLLVWPSVSCSVQGHPQNTPGPVLWELLLGDTVPSGQAPWFWPGKNLSFSASFRTRHSGNRERNTAVTCPPWQSKHWAAGQPRLALSKSEVLGGITGLWVCTICVSGSDWETHKPTPAAVKMG